MLHDSFRLANAQVSNYCFVNCNAWQIEKKIIEIFLCTSENEQATDCYCTACMVVLLPANAVCG